MPRGYEYRRVIDQASTPAVAAHIQAQIIPAGHVYRLSCDTRFFMSFELALPLPFIFENTTTSPIFPARPVLPARCKKSTMFLGSSMMNTVRTSGPKSSPRERREVVIRTWGASEGANLGNACGEWEGTAKPVGVV